MVFRICNFSMENTEEYNYYRNGFESSTSTSSSSPKRPNTSRSNVGFNADIGDMCFIMLEYIKDAMKVLEKTSLLLIIL